MVSRPAVLPGIGMTCMCERAKYWHWLPPHVMSASQTRTGRGDLATLFGVARAVALVMVRRASVLPRGGDVDSIAAAWASQRGIFPEERRGGGASDCTGKAIGELNSGSLAFRRNVLAMSISSRRRVTSVRSAACPPMRLPIAVEWP